MADRGSSTGIPRWVWVSAIIVTILVLLVVVVLLAGGGTSGGHRPRRHGDAGGETPPSSITAHRASPDYERLAPATGVAPWDAPGVRGEASS